MAGVSFKFVAFPVAAQIRFYSLTKPSPLNCANPSNFFIIKGCSRQYKRSNETESVHTSFKIQSEMSSKVINGNSTATGFKPVTHCIFDMDGLLLGVWNYVINLSTKHCICQAFELHEVFQKYQITHWLLRIYVSTYPCQWNKRKTVA